MGHKTDRQARRKKLEEQEARADFRKKLKEATKEVRTLYSRCRKAVRRAAGRRGTIYIDAPTYIVARAAAALLTHPCHGYMTNVWTDSTPDGSHERYRVAIFL